MEGSPPAGGGKKLSAKALECIKAEGGGEQTGRIVGASIGASASGFVTGIPFVGPVLAGFVALFGADQGAQVGGELATSINIYQYLIKEKHSDENFPITFCCCDF